MEQILHLHFNILHTILMSDMILISFQKNVIMAMECVREKKESSITSTLCFADGVQHIQAHCTQIAEHIKYNK